jgi:hypothetical protein
LQVMLESAGHLLDRDPSRIVFLDGRTFSRRYQIGNVINAAASLHQRWHILECVCTEEIARRRLEEQSASGEHPAGNRNFQLYLEVKARFETITVTKTVIDTGKQLETCIDQAFAVLR